VTRVTGMKEQDTTMDEAHAAREDTGEGHATGDDHARGARRGDTRLRIQQVALELFAEQGYERTSLREISERLGITKAALYYHFRSKEDIAHSLTDDYLAEIDELIRWAATQPRTDEVRGEVIRRYVAILLGRSEVFRFLEQNRAAVQGLEHGKKRMEVFRGRMEALVGVLAGPDAPLRSRMRTTAALFAVSATCVFFREEGIDPGEFRSIVHEMATDLVLSPGPSA
jgi:AcrR family transcriptional regulator